MIIVDRATRKLENNMNFEKIVSEVLEGEDDNLLPGVVSIAF